VCDVVYKTCAVHLPVLVPGGLCAPPRQIECPVLAVFRADFETSRRCKGRGAVIYLHGNGTDIGGVSEEAKTLARELECHVFVPEYPGYGLAEGESTEDTVDATTHACVRFVTETLGVPNDRLLLYGRSVGTGPAAVAATRARARSPFGPPAALILQSPYTSVYDYARERAGGFLSALLVSERWPTRENVQRVGCPVLLIHGDKDEVIPFRHSTTLREDARRRKSAAAAAGGFDSGFGDEIVCLHVQKGASHNAFDFIGDVAEPIASFLKRHGRAPYGPWEASTGMQKRSRGGGVPLNPMGLDLRRIQERAREAGPGEMEEYPFANIS